MQTEENYLILLLDILGYKKNKLLSYSPSLLLELNTYIRVVFVTEIWSLKIYYLTMTTL